MASNQVHSNRSRGDSQGLRIKQAMRPLGISNSPRAPICSMRNKRTNSLQQGLKLPIRSMPRRGLNSLQQATTTVNLDTQAHMEFQIHTIMLQRLIIRPIHIPLWLLPRQGQAEGTTLNQERSNIGLEGSDLRNKFRTPDPVRRTVSQVVRWVRVTKSG